MTDPRDLADLADAHALGVLDAAEEAEVERRLADEPALAVAVAAARERLLALDLAAPPAAPSPDLWDTIAARIAAAPAASRPLPPARPAARRARGRPPERRWRLAALGASAAAILLAALLGFTVLTARPPVVVAVLLDAGGEPVALVEAFAGDTIAVTPLSGLDADAARTLQVWTKWDEGVGPVSLGLLERVAATRLGRPDMPDPREGQLYEITLEPAGGSPTGRPTGPIVGKGLAKAPRL
jgi:anti-sigma-K factor RskA